MYTEFEESVKRDIIQWYIYTYQKSVETIGLPRAAQLYWNDYFRVSRENMYLRQHSS